MRKQVIIIGGGFGGINAAKSLKNADVDILLIDRMNHHLFQPLLYQVATAALAVSSIASPLREILRYQKNVKVLMANVDKIDVNEQQVYLSDGDVFHYDELIVAAGARHSYFGNDHWEAYAPGLKTAADAVRIREQILLAFEKAERSEDPVKAQSYLNFVIIGAGPTGVELAGSLGEFAHRTLSENFRNIDPKTSKIYLIEAADQVLPTFPKELGENAKKDLEALGVTVLLKTFVTDVTPQGVKIGEELLSSPNIIWAAGNQASPLLKTLHVPLDKQGRVLVNPDLSIPDHPNVFVIGDAAACKDNNGKWLPGIAPVAIQQARYVAKLIKNKVPVEVRKPFSYFDKGNIATIGRGKAVAILRKLKISGFFAWLIWSVVHIFYLISFRNRWIVSTQWLFWYVTNRRQVRIVNRPIDKFKKH